MRARMQAGSPRTGSGSTAASAPRANRAPPNNNNNNNNAIAGRSNDAPRNARNSNTPASASAASASSAPPPLETTNSRSGRKLYQDPADARSRSTFRRTADRTQRLAMAYYINDGTSSDVGGVASGFSNFESSFGLTNGVVGSNGSSV